MRKHRKLNFPIIKTYQHVLEIFLDFVMLKSVLDYSENRLKSIHDVNNPILSNVLHIIESIMRSKYYSKQNFPCLYFNLIWNDIQYSDWLVISLWIYLVHFVKSLLVQLKVHSIFSVIIFQSYVDRKPVDRE